MAGIYEQNPVTLRIEKMRMKWNEKITNPAIQFVRWLIQPGEMKMVEAFCKLEGTEFAQLPDLFLIFKSNFNDLQSYDKALLEEWLSCFEDEKVLKDMEEAGVKLNWDHRPFKNMAQPDLFAALYSHLQSFDQFQGNMVIYLMPTQCYNVGSLKKWIEKKLENLPPRMRIMVHENIGDEQFDSLMTGNNRVNIMANLDMNGAVQELIKARANTGSPQGKYTECIMMMGQAAEKNDMDLLNEWGEKALICAQKLKDPSMEITAYISWGASTQAMKDLSRTLEHYDKAITFAEKILPKNKENQSIVILFLQTLTFKAGVLLCQKKLKEAMQQYIIIAEQSKAYNQPHMEIEAWCQVAEIQKRLSNIPQMIESYKKAFDTGLTLDVEARKASRFPTISKTLIDLVKGTDPSLKTTIHNKMTEMMGSNWYETVADTYMPAPETVQATS